jgi:hypothetical protein
MARGRIALILLGAVVVGAGMLAVVRLAPTGPVATGPVAKPAEPRSAEPPPSERAIGAVPGGVTKALARPAVPRRFTGLHITFPRTSHPVIYEVRGPQKPAVELLCGACPADNPTRTSDARITLMEWNP